jgi:hypothetical protein
MVHQPACPHCGAISRSTGAHFCGHCGARLTSSPGETTGVTPVSRAPEGRSGFAAAAVVFVVLLTVGYAVLALIARAFR